MNNGLIEIIGISQAITWNSWAVQYFFFIGLSVGGICLAAPVYLLRKTDLLPVARSALLVALTTGLVAPVALLADLHQPARFYQFYLNFTPTSWMSWGAFLLPAFLLSLLYFSWQGLYRGPRKSDSSIRLAAAGTLLLGALIALYTGSEMGVLISRPLWQPEWLVALYLISGFSGATGLTLVLHALLNRTDLKGRKMLSQSLTVSLLITGLLIGSWMVAGFLGASPSGVALWRLTVEYQSMEVLALWLGAGLVVPLALSLPNLRSADIGIGLLALFGTWMVRWILFIGGQGIPKNGAGFYHFDLAWGSEGVLGIIGSIGLWLFMILLLRHLLVRHHKQANV